MKARVLRRTRTHSSNKKLEESLRLARRRVRVAVITIALIIGLLLVLAVARGVAAWAASPHLMEYLKETTAGIDADPLGIASGELVCRRVSDDASIIWYSSAGGRAYTSALVDHALRTKGWISCTAGEQVLDSYLRYSSGSRMPEYATVLYYEFDAGCSIVIEILR